MNFVNEIKLFLIGLFCCVCFSKTYQKRNLPAIDPLPPAIDFPLDSNRTTFTDTVLLNVFYVLVFHYLFVYNCV